MLILFKIVGYKLESACVKRARACTPLAEECPSCGYEKALSYLFKGKIICKECYDKLKSIKSKKELSDWFKEIGIEEELIPKQVEKEEKDKNIMYKNYVQGDSINLTINNNKA